MNRKNSEINASLIRNILNTMFAKHNSDLAALKAKCHPEKEVEVKVEEKKQEKQEKQEKKKSQSVVKVIKNSSSLVINYDDKFIYEDEIDFTPKRTSGKNNQDKIRRRKSSGKSITKRKLPNGKNLTKTKKSDQPSSTGAGDAWNDGWEDETEKEQEARPCIIL